MKKTIFCSLILVFLLTSFNLAENTKYIPFQPSAEVQYVPDEFVVSFKADAGEFTPVLSKGMIQTGNPGLDVLNRKFGISKMEKEFPGAEGRLSRYHIMKFYGRRNLEKVMEAYASLPFVDRVEPIGIHPLLDIYPNDYYFSGQAAPWYQWALHNSGDHDINAPGAWQINTGSTGVILVIMDSGVRYYHKDLGGSSWPTTTGNIWINPGEIKNNKKDDDGNGYKDDWIGWDFVTGVTGCMKGEDCRTEDNDPRDFTGHGTHCAGIAAAMANNARGVAGVAGGWGDETTNSIGNGCKIMCLRIGWLASNGYGYVRMDFAAKAMYYAANKGATVINCSWGSSNSGGLADAVNYAISKGCLIVHAAGNNGNSTADYLGSRTDVLNVAATDSLDVKASFSSYGTWVDVCAPGVDIVSTYHYYLDQANDYVAVMSGTSMSTPFVTGEAALIKSKYPSYTWSDIFNQIKNTADNIDALNPGYAGLLGSGRINACRALGGTPNPKLYVEGSNIPTKFSLDQNYPNPFNPTTNISFALPSDSKISLNIYNIMGQKVKTLVDGITKAGTHTVTWDGTNEQGESVASGIYFYKLSDGDKVITKKMSLLK